MTNDKRLQEIRDEIKTISLTDQEKEDAIFEAQLKKWNIERNRYYWENQKGAFEGDKGEIKL